MDVTTDNQAEAIALFEKSLLDPGLEFIAFDLEMTGIGFSDAARTFRIYKTDTLEERYRKMKTVASNFGIIQFGVTLFSRSAGKSAGAAGAITARPFNCVVFPGADGADFVISPGAIKFLAKNHLDFGQWFNTGVQFVNRRGEEALRERMFPQPLPPPPDAEGSSSASAAAADVAPPKAKRERLMLTKEADVNFIASSMEGVKAFLATDPPPGQQHLFEPCNGFLRKALYEALEEAFPETSFDTEKVESSSYPRLAISLPLTGAALAAKEEAQAIEKQRRFDEKVGLRRVWTAMSRRCNGADGAFAQVPVVGHNCLYDIMFMVHTFEQDLPHTYRGFKTLAHSLFPLIVDTKYLTTHGSARDFFHSTALGDLFKAVSVETEKHPHLASIDYAKGFDGYRSGGDAFHEAGWDSYCTGVVFLRLCERSGLCTGTNGQIVLPPTSVNYLHIMQNYRILDFDTTRTDPATAFDPYNFRGGQSGLLLHVAWDESARVNNDLLKRAFGEAGEEAGLGPLSLNMYWLDKVQCLVELYTLGGEQQLSAAWPAMSRGIEKKHAEMRMGLQSAEAFAEAQRRASLAREAEAEACGLGAAPGAGASPASSGSGSKSGVGGLASFLRPVAAFLGLAKQARGKEGEPSRKRKRPDE